MILNIKNLGALKEAEIDLSKDLILLCGHNNTGKTYVAYAIYDFLANDISYFTVKAEDFFIESKNNISINTIDFYKKNKHEFELDIKKKKERDARELFHDNANFNNIKYTFSLPDIDSISSELENNFSSSLPFSHIPSLIRKDKSTWYFEISDSESIISLIKKNRMIQYFIGGNLSRILGFKQALNIKIFSSERAAINIFSKELALNKNQFFDKILKTKGEDRTKLLHFADENINRYQKPIADELLIAEDLLHLQKQKSEFEFLAIELEKSILKGKISVNQYGGLQYQPNFYNENEENVVLEIYQTSSLVKSLASLVFYLRHLAEKNDCIIIDEPELNLHPDNQILVARFLARLVNEGFKVVASTHSDYVIRELSNLLMLSNSFGEKEELMKTYGYNENELLKNEQVGVYYFEKGKNTAVNVPLLKRGIEIDSIDLVIANLNERSDDIYYTFLESDENKEVEKKEAKKAEENLQNKSKIN